MKESNYLQQIKQAAEFISEKTNYQPEIGLILGSGLGMLADKIENPDSFPFENIPHFPVSTVEGHQGQIVIGQLKGKTVLALQGRVHYYEGYTMKEVTFPVRVMQQIGVKTLIVTNSCGGLREPHYPGSLMFIKDQINLMGDNPLMGENFVELGVRFPDMSKAYSPELLNLGRSVAKDLGISMFEGVFAAVSGPTYETHAELHYLRIIGADAVGMSTVPEVIVANHSGIKTLGISCITDVPLNNPGVELTHEEVVETAAKARPLFINLVSGIIEKM